MHEIKLGERLSAAASLVRANRPTADIGTDHGYLPAFLVLSGKTDDVTASDIAEGPLKNAEKTLKKYGLQDKVKLVLSDGLENVPQSTEEITITGMGGNLITEILSRSDMIKREDIHLILQPMTHSYDVRKYLCENGFYIKEEKYCLDEGKVYAVISAFFYGGNTAKNDFYYFFGEASASDSVSLLYIKKQIKFISSRADGLKKSGREAQSEYYGELKAAAMKKWRGFL